jgi:hypothetical protein
MSFSVEIDLEFRVSPKLPKFKLKSIHRSLPSEQLSLTQGEGVPFPAGITRTASFAAPASRIGPLVDAVVVSATPLTGRELHRTAHQGLDRTISLQENCHSGFSRRCHMTCDVLYQFGQQCRRRIFTATAKTDSLSAGQTQLILGLVICQVDTHYSVHHVNNHWKIRGRNSCCGAKAPLHRAIRLK